MTQAIPDPIDKHHVTRADYAATYRLLMATTAEANAAKFQQRDAEFDLVRHVWRCYLCEWHPIDGKHGFWKFCLAGHVYYAKVVKLRGYRAQAGSDGHRDPRSKEVQGARLLGGSARGFSPHGASAQ